MVNNKIARLHQQFASKQFENVKSSTAFFATEMEAYFYLVSSNELGQFEKAYGEVTTKINPLPIKLVTVCANIMSKANEFLRAREFCESYLVKIDKVQDSIEYGNFIFSYINALIGLNDFLSAYNYLEADHSLSLDFKKRLLEKLNHLEALKNTVLIPEHTSIEKPVIDEATVSDLEAESIKTEPKIIQVVAEHKRSKPDVALRIFQILKQFDVNIALSMISSVAVFLVYVFNRKSENRIGRFFRLMELRLVQTIKMAAASV